MKKMNWIFYGVSIPLAAGIYLLYSVIKIRQDYLVNAISLFGNLVNIQGSSLSENLGQYRSLAIFILILLSACLVTILVYSYLQLRKYLKDRKGIAIE